MKIMKKDAPDHTPAVLAQPKSFPNQLKGVPRWHFQTRRSSSPGTGILESRGWKRQALAQSSQLSQSWVVLKWQPCGRPSWGRAVRRSNLFHHQTHGSADRSAKHYFIRSHISGAHRKQKYEHNTDRPKPLADCRQGTARKSDHTKAEDPRRFLGSSPCKATGA